MSKISDAEAMSICIKNGVTIYPVYNECKRFIKKKEYNGYSWFIEVNNNGTKKIYNKPIGTGTILSYKRKSRKKNNLKYVNSWHDSIMKTWQHWAKLINEQT